MKFIGVCFWFHGLIMIMLSLVCLAAHFSFSVVDGNPVSLETQWIVIAMTTMGMMVGVCLMMLSEQEK